MSTQAASKFLEKVANDQVLGEKLFGNVGSKQERFEAFVTSGREHGFTFDGQDVESLLASARSSEEGSLDERDLEAVVGGVSFRVLVGKAYAWLGGGTGGDDGANVASGVRG